MLPGFGFPFAYPNLHTILWDNNTSDLAGRPDLGGALLLRRLLQRADRRLLGRELRRRSTRPTGRRRASALPRSTGPQSPSFRTRAQHATDTTALGTGKTPFPVFVRNVAPVIRSAAVTDPLGRDLDGGANLAIAGVPVQLAVTFTDPGRADTQTASIAWGDGVTDTSFRTFSDAHNGATGQLRRRLRLRRARHLRDRGDHHR